MLSLFELKAGDEVNCLTQRRVFGFVLSFFELKAGDEVKCLTQRRVYGLVLSLFGVLRGLVIYQQKFRLTYF